jgi:hypothetical protein
MQCTLVLEIPEKLTLCQVQRCRLFATAPKTQISADSSIPILHQFHFCGLIQVLHVSQRFLLRWENNCKSGRVFS